MTTHQPVLRPMLALAVVLIGALVLTLAPLAPADAGEGKTMAEYAQTFRGNGTLHEGCRNYRYKYKITPPEDADTWALETFLTDRRGTTIASDGILKGAAKAKGTARFRFCRENTVPGRFKLRGKFTYKVGFDTFDGWIEPTFFRLKAQ
jgi:hypothetical protein